MAGRLKAMGQAAYQKDGDPRTSGPGFGLTLHPDRLDQPLRWRKPRRIFVDSMSDLFHEQVPDEFVDRVFAIMARSPRHTFQVLTKRPERMRDYLTLPVGEETRFNIVSKAAGYLTFAWPLPNVWLGTSIENSRWNVRANALRETPAAVRFISAEPLLGPLVGQTECRVCEATGWLTRPFDEMGDVVRCGECRGAGTRWLGLDLTGIDWLIVGGESGPGARPMHSDWVRSLRDYAVARGVAFLFKQWGEWGRGSDFRPGASVMAPDGRLWTEDEFARDRPDWRDHGGGFEYVRRVGKGRAGRELDGRLWDEYPGIREEDRA